MIVKLVQKILCYFGRHFPKKFVWEAHMIETRLNAGEKNHGLVRKWECGSCGEEIYSNWDYKK